MERAAPLAVLCALLAGCGGGIPPATPDAARSVAAPPASPSPASPSASPATPCATTKPPPGRLGHYSSGDGLTGFVLDRTGKKPRMRLDGTNEVVELEPEPAPRNETALTVHLKGVVMRLGERGEVTYFRGSASIPMSRDADAEPLP